MKFFIKKSEAKQIQENPASKFNEYNLPFKNFAVGISEINGRYPDIGFDMDEEIEQVWYVEKGKGKIWMKDVIYELNSGDMILIPKAEKYWIEGELNLVVISFPPWFPKQHKHLDK